MADKSLDIFVKFGNVTFGDHTASVSMAVARESLNIMAADELLCGHRLVGLIRVQSPEEGNEQRNFDGFERPEIKTSFDVKSFHANPNNITATLSFSLKDVDGSTLSRFAKKQGKLIVDQVLAIPAEEKGGKKKDAADPNQKEFDDENSDDEDAETEESEVSDGTEGT